MKNQSHGLARNLQSRHIMMIALGGSIGAGIFKGSSDSISVAGPGVVISYLIGGLLLLAVMQGLAEMVVHNRGARTHLDLIEKSVGRFAGYSVGWMSWFMYVVVMAAEIVASAFFLQYWFTDTPLWVLSLIVSLVITALNLFKVNVFGEVEYVLTGIKVSVLALFIFLGGYLLFFGTENFAPVGFTNLTAHEGFFPLGLSGIAASMLVVMFSFGGSEMIGMTLAETEQPEKVIPRAARGVILRILVFYALPILIIVGLVPWNQISASASPFITVFESVGIPYVADFMNFVMLIAMISAANSNMYASSRMLFAKAQDGRAPKFLAVLSKQKSPVRAILVCVLFLYLGVLFAFFAEEQTFGYLMIIPAYTVMSVWIMLLVAHLRSRKTESSPQGYRAFGAPVTTWMALISLLIIFVGVVITSPVMGTVFYAMVLLVITGSYLLYRKESDKGTQGNQQVATNN
ncbi:amino acid permease [Brevibacillus sp. SYSU BS000544]|uniref:amino acid permease n=1 Tax=Brevibacillus sp. SYSU BS000544 TaxID=3416443 RepID=UPI003CE44AC8